jgi:hypothetical protein
VTSQPRDSRQRDRQVNRRSDGDPASSEYVDYRPINDDSETDNWGDY